VVDIHDVQLVPPNGQFHLDSPSVGTSTGWTIDVAGWLSLNNVETIELLHNGGIIRQAVQAARLRRHHRFSIPLDTLLLPENFTVEVTAELKNGERISMASFSGRRSPLTIPYQPAFRPLMVLGMGRSGTTLLMRCLSAHPQIAVHPQHPYEIRMIAYWLSVFGVLTAPADFQHSSHPDTFFDNLHSIGHPPFVHPGVQQWRTESLAPDAAAFCLRQIDSFYARSEARFCAEKWAGTQFGHAYLWSFYRNPRVLFIVRDWRDRHCSLTAFNKKRGYAAFGVRAGQSDAAFVRQAYHRFRMFAHIWRTHPDAVHLLRYEDLIRNPRETLATAFQACELDVSDDLLTSVIAAAHQETPELSSHRTTRDGHTSIGRWKHELSPTLQKLYAQQFGDFLEEFGYEG
jgi:LPS sulfotransferase NodH